MGRSDRCELHSRLVVLIMHLLKWRQQPGARSRSWSATIEEQRLQIENAFAEPPSLRPFAAGMLAQTYAIARARAIAKTGLADEAFQRLAHFRSTTSFHARSCRNRSGRANPVLFSSFEYLFAFFPLTLALHRLAGGLASGRSN